MTIPEETEKSKTAAEDRPFYKVTRMILLAGIGAVSLAQDEINTFLDRLVERGEMAEADARKLVKEVTDRRQKLEQERRLKHQEGAASSSVTKSDIEALNQRIAELTRQLEELRNQQS